MGNSFIESLRAAISFAERAQNAELLGAFQKALLDGQGVIDDNLQLRDEVRSLRDRVAALEERLRFAESLQFIHGLYHVVDATGEIGEPYCPNCWEVNRLPVHLHWWSSRSTYHCYACSKYFGYGRRHRSLKVTEIAEVGTTRPPMSLQQIQNAASHE